MGFGIVKTPFDYLGDTLRGTKGILMDMYRLRMICWQPGSLCACSDQLDRGCQ